MEICYPDNLSKTFRSSRWCVRIPEHCISVALRLEDLNTWIRLETKMARTFKENWLLGFLL